MRLHDFAHDLVHRGFVGGVARDRMRRQPARAQAGGAVLHHLAAAPEQVDRGAEFGQRAGHGQAQVGPTTGDHRHCAVER